jgi:carbamoyltransferase
MGLAPYGRPRPEWGNWLGLDGPDIRVSQKELEEIYNTLLSAEGQGYDSSAPNSWRHPFAEDIAYKVQSELERAMLHLADQTRQLTGKSNLCLAGGTTLNSVANQRVRSEGPFDEVFIPAPAGDAGNAIGVALYGWHTLLSGARRTIMRTAALGREYDEADVSEALRSPRVAGKITCRRAGPDEVAELLAKHFVVGWSVGRSEMGPRALGHRSILADPRHPGMRDFLNLQVKHREPFRPYAPSVLAEHVGEWFDFTGESPFMLLVPAVREDRRDSVPAITHVDGTARVQTVQAGVEPAYYQLISSFHRLTGVPLVLNTSFNDAGEPIVETPLHAVCTYLRTKLDYLYLDGWLISRAEPGELPPDHPHLSPLPTAQALYG